MIRFLIAYGIVASLTSGMFPHEGDEIVLQVTYDSTNPPRFNVTFRAPQQDQAPTIIHGFASLYPSSSYSSLSQSGIIRPLRMNRIYANSIEFESSDSTHRFSPRPSVGIIDSSNPDDWQNLSVLIGCEFNSPFMDEYEGFILSPISRNSGRLILRPRNPQVYAFQGEWFYAQSTHPVVPKVLASVLVEGNPSHIMTPSPSQFRVDLVRKEHLVPPIVLHQLVDQFNRLGIQTYTVSRDNRDVPPPRHSEGRLLAIVRTDNQDLYRSIEFIGPSIEAFTNILPTITFRVVDVDGQQISLPVYPHDYLQQDEFEVEKFEMLFLGAYDQNRWTIGSSLLSRIALHIDGENHLIGFGEPLTEL